MTLINAAFVEDHWLWNPFVDRDQHMPEWGTFNIDVPEGVWNAYVEARDAQAATESHLLAASGLAAKGPTLLRACGLFRQDKPDPQRFMADSLSRRCQMCGHLARDHEARQAVA